jgi:hypothetical protein
MSAYLNMPLLVLDTNCGDRPTLMMTIELSKGFIMKRELLDTFTMDGHAYEVYQHDCTMGEQFRLTLDIDGKTELSMYLDTTDALGSVGEPYVEMYSYKYMDTVRLRVSEYKELLQNEKAFWAWCGNAVNTMAMKDLS